jgi:hypothetical protein
MQSCLRCGAVIDPTAVQCPYCQTQTQYGRWQAERQAAHEAQLVQAERLERERRRQAEQQQLAKRGRNALLWSLGGSLICCFPVALVGLLIALDVRRAAKREQLTPPGTTSAALALSAVAALMTVVMIALYVQDSRARDARMAELSVLSGPGRSRVLLEQRVACALVELQLLQEGYAGKSGINIAGFQCDGRLELSGDRATLNDVRFRTGTDERRVVTACLERGERWSVKELRADGSCATRVHPASSGSGADGRTAP